MLVMMTIVVSMYEQEDIVDWIYSNEMVEQNMKLLNHLKR
jgi:hypothetical protein